MSNGFTTAHGPLGGLTRGRMGVAGAAQRAQRGPGQLDARGAGDAAAALPDYRETHASHAAAAPWPGTLASSNAMHPLLDRTVCICDSLGLSRLVAQRSSSSKSVAYLITHPFCICWLAFLRRLCVETDMARVCRKMGQQIRWTICQCERSAVECDKLFSVDPFLFF